MNKESFGNQNPLKKGVASKKWWARPDLSDNLVSQIFKNELTAKTIGAQFDILNRTLKLDGEPDVWIIGRGD